MKHLELIQKKIKTATEIKHLLSVWRFKEEKIVFTNGCFDILHQGHIHLLSAAADLGKHLIIGLNSDASIQRIKKPGRPLQTEQSRALVLAALNFVDSVIIFDEDTPQNLIELILPDVLVKGGDYTIDTIVGAKTVLENGGDVQVIPLLAGFSTTNIEDKIKSNLPYK